jgi:hypothetical protein
LAGQAFVDAGVPHVVCINLEATITDSAALAFTKAFYLSLFVGNTVQHSFAIGQQAVAASPNVPSPEREVSKFELLPPEGEGCDHNVAIFPIPHHTLSNWNSGRSLSVLDPSWSLQQEQQAHLPTPPEDFLGREVSMYRAVNACLNRRLVTLLGLGGIGKSALVAACCHYMALRRFFVDGLVFVRLQGKTTMEELIQSIIQGVLRQLPSQSSSSSATSGGGGGGGGGAGGGREGGREGSVGYPPMSPRGEEDGLLEKDEEWLFARLRTAKVLLVLDHLQDLQVGHDGINVKIFLSQLFEQTRAVKVMVTTTRPLDLHTLPGSGNGVVGETLVSVGPLTFKNTVRLFSRLCPHLHTARDRRVSPWRGGERGREGGRVKEKEKRMGEWSFPFAIYMSSPFLPPSFPPSPPSLLQLLLESLVWPDDQKDVTIASRDITPRTYAILERMGEGHPARILKRAYEISEQEVLALLRQGQESKRRENEGN